VVIFFALASALDSVFDPQNPGRKFREVLPLAKAHVIHFFNTLPGRGSDDTVNVSAQKQFKLYLRADLN